MHPMYSIIGMCVGEWSGDGYDSTPTTVISCHCVVLHYMNTCWWMRKVRLRQAKVNFAITVFKRLVKFDIWLTYRKSRTRHWDMDMKSVDVHFKIPGNNFSIQSLTVQLTLKQGLTLELDVWKIVCLMGYTLINSN